jgi:sortase A
MALAAAAFAALSTAAWQLGSAAYIHAKAVVAQGLIRTAWARGVGTGNGPPPPPWPWADMRPVARLRVSAKGIDQFVLSNASNRVIAFGPALVSGTAAPGAPGTSVLAGHRDTHFRFLQDLAPGDRLQVQDAAGNWHGFRVTDSKIVHKDAIRVPLQADPPRLLLVTCYPFDALTPGGPMRYAVSAVKVAKGP